MLISAARHPRCWSLSRCLSTRRPPQRGKSNHERPSTFVIDPIRPGRSSTNSTPSLIEELFPLEITGAKHATKSTIKPRRVAPIRPVELNPQPGESLFDTNDQGPETGDGLPQTNEAPIELGKPAKSQDEAPHVTEEGRRARLNQSGVLILRKAGKHLSEEDFKRAQPTGRHIEGWTSSGEGMKVIRSRNLETMAPNGDYILLFKDAQGATAYKENAQRLHYLSRTYTPAAGDLRGPIPPPPIPEAIRQMSSGEDIPAQSMHDEIASYALLPPSQSISIRHVLSPLAPVIRGLLKLEGYEPLVRNRRTRFEVLLRVDGWQPTLHTMRGIINDDGQDRHLHWDIAGRSKGIREVLLPRHSAQKASQSEAQDGETTTTTTTTPTDAEQQGEEDESAKAWKIWIVSFWKEDEAQRFVAAWHRRDVAPLMRLRRAYLLPEDEEVVMNAELIW